MLRTFVGLIALSAIAVVPTARADDSTSPEAPLYADFSNGKVSGNLQVDEVGTDQNPYYGGSHRLLINNYSRVTASFSLETMPTSTVLKIEHLTSSFGSRPGYSPVNIIVNGHTVAENYSPQAMNYIWDTFDISSAVQEGINEVVIELQNAQSHYWLRRIEIWPQA